MFPSGVPSHNLVLDHCRCLSKWQLVSLYLISRLLLIIARLLAAFMTVGICACCFHPRWMTLLRNSTSVSHSCWSDQLPFRGCFQPFPVAANCWKQCLSKSRGSFLSPHYLLLHYISKRQLLEGCLLLVSCSGHVSKLGGNCCFVDRKKTAWYYGLRSPHAGFWKAGRKFILEENIGNTLQETGVGKNVLKTTPQSPVTNPSVNKWTTWK